MGRWVAGPTEFLCPRGYVIEGNGGGCCWWCHAEAAKRLADNVTKQEPQP